MSNSKHRSSVQLASDLGLCQKSARHLAQRIREALADGLLPCFDGPRSGTLNHPAPHKIAKAHKVGVEAVAICD